MGLRGQTCPFPKAEFDRPGPPFFAPALLILWHISHAKHCVCVYLMCNIPHMCGYYKITTSHMCAYINTTNTNQQSQMSIARPAQLAASMFAVSASNGTLSCRHIQRRTPAASLEKDTYCLYSRPRWTLLLMFTSFLTSFLPLAMRLRSRSRAEARSLLLHFRSRDKQSDSSRRPTLTSTPAAPMTHAVPSHHSGFLAATIVATTIAAGGAGERICGEKEKSLTRVRSDYKGSLLRTYRSMASKCECNVRMSPRAAVARALSHSHSVTASGRSSDDPGTSGETWGWAGSYFIQYIIQNTNISFTARIRQELGHGSPCQLAPALPGHHAGVTAPRRAPLFVAACPSDASPGGSRTGSRGFSSRWVLAPPSEN